MDYQRHWQKPTTLAPIFDAEVTALHREIETLRQKQHHNLSPISVLDLITSLQLAVWKLGNPKATFSRCWKSAFSQAPTPEKVVATFWEGLIAPCRVGLINWILNGSGDLSFILQEYERKTFGHNIHCTPVLDLEHIFPVNPALPIPYVAYGFKDEKSYRDFLNKIENRTYIHQSLNRAAQAHPPFLKIRDYIDQQCPPHQEVCPVVKTTRMIGEALGQIQSGVAGTKSPLYRAWLQLWGVRLAIFAATYF